MAKSCGNLATLQALGQRLMKVLHYSHSYPMPGNSMTGNCYVWVPG